MPLDAHSLVPNPVSVHTRVEWVDTDAAGHHHNSSIMRWVESAEAELMRRAELADYFPRAPRVHQSIDFRSKLTFGQTVRTQLWIDRIGTTSLTFEFEVAGRRSGPADTWITAATGTLVTAHVPIGAKGAAPWPQEWLIAFSHYRWNPETKTSTSAPTDGLS